MFYFIINEMFFEVEELDNTLKALIFSEKSFKFQLIFQYSENMDVLQNT
jgi:hypothetical protein